jgi:hypothetical protein
MRLLQTVAAPRPCQRPTTLTAGLAGPTVTRRWEDQRNDQDWARQRERGRADHPHLRQARAIL